MKPEVGVVVIHGRMLHAVRLEIVQPFPAPLLHRQIGFRDGNALADLRAFGCQLILDGVLGAAVYGMLLAVRSVVASFPGSVGALADAVFHYCHCNSFLPVSGVDNGTGQVEVVRLRFLFYSTWPGMSTL